MIHITTKDIKHVINQPTAVTIGNFDGMHQGHMALIEATVNYAKAHGLLSVVFSFAPHPREVIQGIRLPHIFTSAEKKHFIESLAIDVFIEYPFDQAFASESPQFFLEEVLKNSLKTKAIFVGENYRFGQKGTGDTTFMKNFGSQQGIYVHIQQLLCKNGVTIDSTKVRTAIADGDITAANHMLARPFSIEARVVAGDQRGRKMGFPTANILPTDPKKILPKLGVYVTTTRISGLERASITNVGYNPTFGGDHLVIETFILNFSQDIYDEHIVVNFLERIRGEKKFDHVEALIEQITRDVAYAKTYHGLDK